MCNCSRGQVPPQLTQGGDLEVLVQQENLPPPGPNLPPGILYMPGVSESSNIAKEPEVSLDEQLTPRTIHL